MLHKETDGSSSSGGTTRDSRTNSTGNNEKNKGKHPRIASLQSLWMDSTSAPCRARVGWCVITTVITICGPAPGARWLAHGAVPLCPYLCLCAWPGSLGLASWDSSGHRHRRDASLALELGAQGLGQWLLLPGRACTPLAACSVHWSVRSVTVERAWWRATSVVNGIPLDH